MKSRMFFTNFWERPETIKLSVQSRYLFLYISVNSRINLIGLYFLSNEFIAIETGLCSEEIETGKKEIETAGYAYFLKGWIFIPKSQECCGYISDKLAKPIAKELSDVSSGIIDHFISKGYEIPYRYPIDSPRKQKTEIRTHKEENRNTSSDDEIDVSDIDF